MMIFITQTTDALQHEKIKHADLRLGVLVPLGAGLIPFHIT